MNLQKALEKEECLKNILKKIGSDLDQTMVSLKQQLAQDPANDNEDPFKNLYKKSIKRLTKAIQPQDDANAINAIEENKEEEPALLSIVKSFLEESGKERDNI